MDGGGEGNISLLIGVFKFVVDFLERNGPGRTCAGTDGAAPAALLVEFNPIIPPKVEGVKVTDLCTLSALDTAV